MTGYQPITLLLPMKSVIAAAAAAAAAAAVVFAGVDVTKAAIALDSDTKYSIHLLNYPGECSFPFPHKVSLHCLQTSEVIKQTRLITAM